MPNLSKEARVRLLDALSKIPRGFAEHAPPQMIYPISEHLRALEAEVVLIVGDRGAGKTQLKNALDTAEVRDALVRYAPGVKVPPGRVDWVVGWPLGTQGPDSRGWRDMLGASSGDQDRSEVWGAYLLRAVRGHLSTAEQEPLRTVLDAPGADAKQVLSAMRQAGVQVTTALDALDERLAREQRWLFVAYDELDTLVMEDWEALGNAIRGLVSHWAVYARRWRRLRPKIFLRSDFYKHHREIAGADVAKLAGNRVELHWSDKNLYGALIKHLLNAEALGGATPLKDYLLRSVQGREDPVLGFVPELATAADAKPFVHRLISEYMGANQGKGRTFAWILDHLRDGNKHALPRSLIALIADAADIERDQPRATGAHLLHHVSVRNALDRVSKEYVGQARTHELPWLEGLATRLQRSREVPWTKRELTNLLGAQYDGLWATHGARPPGSDKHDLLESLIELGVVRSRPKDMFDVPDLYLHGLGLRRKGGVAKQ